MSDLSCKIIETHVSIALSTSPCPCEHRWVYTGSLGHWTASVHFGISIEPLLNYLILNQPSQPDSSSSNFENCVVFYERVKSKMVIAIKRGARYITSSSHHHHLTKVYARTKQNKHECNECRRQPSHTWDLYPRSGLRMKRVHTTTPKKKPIGGQSP